MTRAQLKRFNRLRKQQANRSDISVVETSASSVTFHVPFPGLYLTYDNDGKLMFSETEAERKSGSKELARPGHINPVVGGEMGSEHYLPGSPKHQEVKDDDDSIPF